MNEAKAVLYLEACCQVLKDLANFPLTDQRDRALELAAEVERFIDENDKRKRT